MKQRFCSFDDVLHHESSAWLSKKKKNTILFQNTDFSLAQLGFHLGQPMIIFYFFDFLKKLCQFLIYCSVFFFNGPDWVSWRFLFCFFFFSTLNIPKWLIHTARTFYNFLLSIGDTQLLYSALSFTCPPSLVRIQFIRLIDLTAFFSHCLR